MDNDVSCAHNVFAVHIMTTYGPFEGSPAVHNSYKVEMSCCRAATFTSFLLNELDFFHFLVSRKTIVSIKLVNVSSLPF